MAVLKKCCCCNPCCVSRIEIDFGIPLSPIPTEAAAFQGTLAWDVSTFSTNEFFLDVGGVPRKICQQTYTAPVLYECGFDFNIKKRVLEREIDGRFTNISCGIPGATHDVISRYDTFETWKVDWQIRNAVLKIQKYDDKIRYVLTGGSRFFYFKYPSPGGVSQNWSKPRGDSYAPICGYYTTSTFGDTYDSYCEMPAYSLNSACPLTLTRPDNHQRGFYESINGLNGTSSWITGDCDSIRDVPLSSVSSDIYNTYNSNPSFSSGGATCDIPNAYAGYVTGPHNCGWPCEGYRGWTSTVRDPYVVWGVKHKVRVLC
jgi:hypothetical protein